LADLKIVPRQGGYARGKDVFEQILRAAFALLVEHGWNALTLRRIASRCGLKAGNLNYYFSSKEDLVRELLNAIINSYEESFDAIKEDRRSTAEQRLEGIVRLILEDITTKETTRIFTELWAMANHDTFVQDRLDEMYQRGRAAINELIAEINPVLPVEERETLAVFFAASLEGLTIFAGHDKPWRDRMPWLERIATTSFVQLARNMKPGEISGATRLEPLTAFRPLRAGRD